MDKANCKVITAKSPSVYVQYMMTSIKIQDCVQYGYQKEEKKLSLGYIGILKVINI